MTGDPLARLAGVAVGYRGTAVLSDVSLTIGRGELWFWLGPNGAGKSTLAKTLLGMLAPRAGAIARGLPLARIGYVPQRCDWNPALPTTAAEFVELGLCGLRTRRRERSDRVARALGAIGMQGLEQRDYWRLSGGQRQRLLLARALVREPDLLVLDEPTTGLDQDSERALLAALERRSVERGTSVVFVTHRHDLAEAHASHIARFGAGRVAVEGPR